MLIERSPTEFVAVCEDCDDASPTMTESRELAMLRLMRMHWRLRTDERGTRTWCPHCHVAPSIPIMRAVRASRTER